MKKCKVCEQPIETTERNPDAFGGMGRKRETCSDRCRQIWSRVKRGIAGSWNIEQERRRQEFKRRRDGRTA